MLMERRAESAECVDQGRAELASGRQQGFQHEGDGPPDLSLAGPPDTGPAEPASGPVPIQAIVEEFLGGQAYALDMRAQGALLNRQL